MEEEPIITLTRSDIRLIIGAVIFIAVFVWLQPTKAERRAHAGLCELSPSDCLPDQPDGM